MAVGGLDALADASGALWLAPERMLLVADLHLEKGSAQARRGSLLPPYDSRATLAALAGVARRYDPATVVVLGDAFHDARAEDRMDEADAESLRGLQRGRDWVWLAGNHDPRPSARFGGVFCQSLVLGGVTLRHAPGGAGGPEIAGHLHPVGKVHLRGRTLRRRCFVSDGSRCVMPAFGAYAGGLNVLDAAFSGLFPDAFAAHVLGRSRVYRIGRAHLRGD
ncbi:MAG: ligase-associated DNA damage response endonuclease PdeM [Alsobacter sp.]